MSRHHHHPLPPPPPSSSSSSSSSISPDKTRPSTPPNLREYMNINIVNGQLDTSSLPLAPGTGTLYSPEYVNLKMVSSDSGTGMELAPQRKIGNGSALSNRRSVTLLDPSPSPPPPPLPTKQRRSDSHVPMSQTSRTSRESCKIPPRRVTECEQCSDLKEWLSLWELGVSGLTRQYSQILAQLNHARDAATIIECKMRESWEAEVKWAEKVVGVARRESTAEETEVEKVIGGSVKMVSKEMKAARRKTMLDAVEEEHVPENTQSQSKAAKLANQMYPPTNRQDSLEHSDGGGGDAPGRFHSEYAKHFSDLSNRLEKAIDICQQLAVASFKTNSSNVIRRKQIGRVTSSPLSLTPDIVRRGREVAAETSTSSSWRPLMRVERVEEEEEEEENEEEEEEGEGERRRRRKTRGVLTRMETEPALKISTTTSERKCHVKGKEEKEKEKEEETKEKERKTPKKSPSLASKISLSRSKTRYVPKKERPSQSSIAGDLFKGGQQEMQRVRSHVIDVEERGGGGGGGGVAGVVVGSSGSEEGGDMVLSSSTFSDTDVKQVMTKIALLEEERLKLLETIDQIQNDNQRVRLSLQETVGDLENKDLQLVLAMQDLTIATDEIRKVAGLRTQLDNMEREREQTLEQLNNLEDESAAVKVSLIQLLQEKSATNKTLTLENWRLRQAVRKGEDLSRTNSRCSTMTREPSLDYTKDDDLSNYVHKQGFLVKQGRRVKNWKRRLFVLDSSGLSYYKTEQPIQRVALTDVSKIQISRNHLLPNMFEVHTPERVFLLSAPSEDEMQSWVGMLQTLKQYARNPSPPTVSQNPSATGDPVLSAPNGTTATSSVTANALLHQLMVDHAESLGGGRGGERTSTLLSHDAIDTGTLDIPSDRGHGEVGGVSHDGRSVSTTTATHSSGGFERRPRSHAVTLVKDISLDEAVPVAARPLSLMATGSLATGGLRWQSIDEAIPEDQDSIEYNRAVLSQSHPGSTIPAISLET